MRNHLPNKLVLLSSLVVACGSAEFDDLSLSHEVAQNPNAIIGEAGALYVSLGTSVERRNTDGVSDSVLSANEAIGGVPAAAYDMALDEGFLYWLRSTSPSYHLFPDPNVLTEVVRIPKLGGTPVIVARLVNAPTRAFAVRGDNLFTCDLPIPSGPPSVSIIGLAGQTRTTRPLGIASAIDCSDLFVDANGVAHVSVLMSPTVSPTWYRVALDGTVAADPSPPVRPGVAWRAKSPPVISGETHELVSTSATGVETVLTTGYDVALVAEGTTVYFKSGVGGGSRKTMTCDTGSVSVLRGTGVPEVLTKGQCGPIAFALTATRVFWIDDRSILYTDGRRETALKSLAR